MSNMRDCTIPVDPNAQVMKMFSVPRGMQFIVNIDGTPNRLEIVNPTDGRAPFFRLYDIDRSSEAIELVQYGVSPYQRTKSPTKGNARRHANPRSETERDEASAEEDHYDHA